MRASCCATWGQWPLIGSPAWHVCMTHGCTIADCWPVHAGQPAAVCQGHSTGSSPRGSHRGLRADCACLLGPSPTAGLHRCCQASWCVRIGLKRRSPHTAAIWSMHINHNSRKHASVLVAAPKCCIVRPSETLRSERVPDCLPESTLRLPIHAPCQQTHVTGMHAARCCQTGHALGKLAGSDVTMNVVCHMHLLDGTCISKVSAYCQATIHGCQ